jgi:hypothetical protein
VPHKAAHRRSAVILTALDVETKAVLRYLICCTVAASGGLCVGEKFQEIVGGADQGPAASFHLVAARQFVISSPTLIAAARRLFTDPRTGRQRRGAGAKGKGSPRRPALIANQLALTYDIHNMSVDQFMKILPREFH